MKLWIFTALLFSATPAMASEFCAGLSDEKPECRSSAPECLYSPKDHTCFEVTCVPRAEGGGPVSSTDYYFDMEIDIKKTDKDQEAAKICSDQQLDLQNIREKSCLNRCR